MRRESLSTGIKGMQRIVQKQVIGVKDKIPLIPFIPVGMKLCFDLILLSLE
jgi:hypothetical protein